MNLPNPSALSKILENLYTFNSSLERLEKGLEDVNRQVSGLRTDMAGLSTRVAVLEEPRKTIDAQMRAVVAETVAELRVQYAEAQAEMRLKQFEKSSGAVPPPAPPPARTPELPETDS